jgi:hypothetical protein
MTRKAAQFPSQEKRRSMRMEKSREVQCGSRSPLDSDMLHQSIQCFFLSFRSPLDSDMLHQSIQCFFLSFRSPLDSDMLHTIVNQFNAFSFLVEYAVLVRNAASSLFSMSENKRRSSTKCCVQFVLDVRFNVRFAPGEPEEASVGNHGGWARARAWI